MEYTHDINHCQAFKYFCSQITNLKASMYINLSYVCNLILICLYCVSVLKTLIKQIQYYYVLWYI